MTTFPHILSTKFYSPHINFSIPRLAHSAFRAAEYIAPCTKLGSICRSYSSCFSLMPLRLPKKNKLRVWIILNHRASLSVGAQRQRLGIAAFHWSIMIAPKQSCGADCAAFDVSDGPLTDAGGRITDPNTAHHWHFREKRKVDPTRSSTLVTQVLVGKLDDGKTIDSVRSALRRVPIPTTGKAAEENCATWALSAYQELVHDKIASGANIQTLRDEALKNADAFIANPDAKKRIINLSGRPLRKRDVAYVPPSDVRATESLTHHVEC